MKTIKAFRRKDGSIAIRNKILIIAVDECCEGISRAIAKKFDEVVVLTNWQTCMLGGNEETFNQLIEVGKHPHVVGVIVVAMGCGSILPEQVADPIYASTKKSVFTLTCQKQGGTRKTIEKGISFVKEIQKEINSFVREDICISELIIGVKCGGSDASSGIAANPAVGEAVDSLVDMGAKVISGELFELLGCEEVVMKRAVNEKVAKKIALLIDNDRKRWGVEGLAVETMSIGNSMGGLTTIEEKAFGSLHKTGTRPIQDVLQINKDFIEKPTVAGMYLSETTMVCGGAGVNFASLGAHLILWTSGAAAFSNPLLPVILVSGNIDLFNEDMDIDARGIMQGTRRIDEVASDIIEKITSIASGESTQVEDVAEATMTLYQKDQRVEKFLQISCKA